MITITSLIMIVFGILGLIGFMIKISEDGKKDILDKMYKSGDIDSKTYLKYLKNGN